MEFGTAYFDNLILRHFRADMEEVRRKGCTFVVLTFAEVNLQFHEETFRAMTAEARRQGLFVVLDPWAVGGVFGGETFTHLPLYHPEDRQVRSDGKKAPALCPNAPSLRTYLKKWVDAAARVGVDYVLWDEPHFYLNWWDEPAGWPPNSKAWSCRCVRCRARFRKETGRPLPARETEAVRDFKRRSLRDFLLELCAHAAKHGLKNAMTFFPDEKPWFLEEMAANPDVHVMGGESYFEYDGTRPKDPRGFARAQTALLKPYCVRYGKPLLMWVKGFRVPKGFEGDVEACIRGCAEGGADWIAMWGFDACRHVSKIACGDPDLVWELMGRTFHSLSGRKPESGNRREAPEFLRNAQTRRT